MEFPQNTKLIFYYYYGTFRGSESDQYTIFLFEDYYSEWLEENNFKEEKNEILEMEIIADTCRVGRERVSKFYYPNFISDLFVVA